MYDFDALMAEVLRNKPEINRDSLMELVQEKKRTVGSGYLTDQGALFLIAGELGVRLQHMITADLTLKDLHIGANDITVVARVLGIYPIAEFKKKDGSGVGRYRRVNLFDRNGVGRLTIWEDSEEAIKLSGIAVDAPVRVISAYVKQGLDGKANLNLGKRGRIEAITDSSISSKLASLSTLSKGVDAVQEGEVVLAVDGLAASDSKRSTFVRRDDGSNGSLTQFELKGSRGNTTRVVIWDGGDLPEVKSGSSVRVTNLRHKKGRQGEAELHGDSATVIQLFGDHGDQGKDLEVESVPHLVKVVEVAERAATGNVTLEVMALSKGSVREVILKDGSTAKKGEVVLGDDTGEITAVAWGEVAKIVGEIQVGEKLRVHDAVIQVSKMGVETLELRSSSKVQRLREKDSGIGK
jgi:ssDNA-binding replication factor A large subunit